MFTNGSSSSCSLNIKTFVYNYLNNSYIILNISIFYFLNISCVKCNLRKLVAQNATPRPSVRIEHQVASLIVTKGLAWS